VHIDINICVSHGDASMMRTRANYKNAAATTPGIVGVGAIVTLLSIAGVHASDRRAHAEGATHCRRVSLLTVDDARYFCASVARVESATRAAATHSPTREDATLMPDTHPRGGHPMLSPKGRFSGLRS
jgi:hypothetical protein